MIPELRDLQKFKQNLKGLIVIDFWKCSKLEPLIIYRLSIFNKLESVYVDFTGNLLVQKGSICSGLLKKLICITGFWILLSGNSFN